ncbi:MAG: hypothetical protein E4H11_09145, partial [Myxococcales bacterium]
MGGGAGSRRGDRVVSKGSGSGPSAGGTKAARVEWVGARRVGAGRDRHLHAAPGGRERGCRRGSRRARRGGRRERAGRRTHVKTTPDGSEIYDTETGYDTAGQVVKVVNPRGFATYFEYDPAGRRE